jgi:hypothetical protein
VQNSTTLKEFEKAGSVALSGFYQWESSRRKAGASLISSPAEPATCQYKNNSDKKPQNSTPKHGYITACGDSKHGTKPDFDAPVSVQACYHKSWTIRLWKKTDVTDQQNVRFTCRSWRHAGPCQEFKGRQDFARIKAGLEKFDGWVYITLTYAHRRKNVQAVYTKIADQVENLRRAIQRKYCRPGEKLQYIALIEQHKDGYPHVNLLIHTADFVAAANANYKSVRRRIAKHIKGTGFGKFWLEPMRNSEAMAGYFSKLCGEVAKTSQAPMRAPKNFRRLRAAQGLLPPANKNPEYTGELVQQDVEAAGRHMFPIRYLENEKTAGEEIVNKERREIWRYENSEQRAGRRRLSILNAKWKKLRPDPGLYFIPRPFAKLAKIA